LAGLERDPPGGREAMSRLAAARTGAGRRLANLAMLALCWLAAAVALLPLLLVLFHVASLGLRSVNLQFFTELPRPVGEPGGRMKQAILGSLTIVGIACLFGLPVGILGGIY